MAAFQENGHFSNLAGGAAELNKLGEIFWPKFEPFLRAWMEVERNRGGKHAERSECNWALFLAWDSR